MVGVVILFFISSNLEISERTINNINKQHIGEDVKLLGKVTNIVETDSVYFIELSQPATIDVIIFKGEKGLSLTQGDNIELIGEVDEYEGKLEIIGHRIRIVK